MKNMLNRRDKNGVPILSRNNIEVWSEEFIKFFDEKCLEVPQQTPLASISKCLQEKYGVKFIFGANLGKTKEGYQYRGQFDIPTTTILIDQSLPEGEPRFNFTLAHEMAHFILHRKIKPEIIGPNSGKIISDTNRDLILDQIQGDSARSWIEWQANKFASSLLLPRSTVPDAVISKQKAMGIVRYLGIIYLDHQQCNKKALRFILEHLRYIYQTSISAIRIRLRELNILRETSFPTQEGAAHIHNIIIKMFGNEDDI